ncbi:helix-turn-helix domain-containing protein [Pelomonas sp. Root1217]|uniref:helix-turn-helix domain-containing protein n=1 Tax=Pelomonas sp. Root1217 TaxID=1736430 RepID=UPI0009E9D179|nr:helix-turn-helix transcriptional regulator [Pelomonas sp. Root1217]
MFIACSCEQPPTRLHVSKHQTLIFKCTNWCVYELVYKKQHEAVKKPTPRVAFGLRLKELRVARDLTQEELADRTGFFRTYMSRLETGAANPTFDALLVLAAALDVAPAALFEQPVLMAPKRAKPLSRPSRGRVSK